MKPLFVALSLLLAISCTSDYTRYVDPFVGTAGFGHTFPGACAPFGMVQPSPVTGYGEWKYCSEYQYEDNTIYGFTQNHLNGTGCPDLGNVLLMPVSGEMERAWDGYRSTFDKRSEKASVGYYTVYLDQPKTKVEITASERVALYKMRYDDDGKSALLIDLQHTPAFKPERLHTHISESESHWEDAQTLVGMAKDKMWTRQTYFYVVKFSRPLLHSTTLPSLEGEKALRYVAEFDIPQGEELLVKVALSSVSIDGAKANLAETEGWDFNRLHRTTKEKWSRLLSRAEVKGIKAEKVNFYTSLYHLFVQPNILSDVDGCYRNAADKVIKGGASQTYSTFSLWDTYRAAHPLYTIVAPERVNDFVVSMLEQGDAQGYLPIWPLWGNETHCMIGNHAIPVIVEAWRKGFRNYDGEWAMDLIHKTQTEPHKKSDWENYLKYGYYPQGVVSSQAVSKTLENAYDDYAAAEMAKMLGKSNLANYFGERAQYFKNVYDKETLCARPRLADGSWESPFDEREYVSYKKGGAFTEATSLQYTWHVQHDVDWLIDFMGGREAFVSRLDSLFIGGMVGTRVDITGLIGHYAHGNEPCHHIPYLYTLAGRSDRTAEVVREVFDTQYSPRHDGLCGNDDCGQMSAWYIFSAMGFYPVNPVSCEYVLGAPQIEEVSLNLNEGKRFTVKAEGLSREAKYVDAVYLNGEKLDRNYITHDEVMQGGELRFVMTK